jgi:hypothetical protein
MFSIVVVSSLKAARSSLNRSRQCDALVFVPVAWLGRLVFEGG